MKTLSSLLHVLLPVDISFAKGMCLFFFTYLTISSLKSYHKFHNYFIYTHKDWMNTKEGIIELHKADINYNLSCLRVIVIYTIVLFVL